MPTVLFWPPFKVLIHPNDHQPPHVHVFLRGRQLRVNLNCNPGGQILGPPQLHLDVSGFKHQELTAVWAFIHQHQALLVEKWLAIHGTR